MAKFERYFLVILTCGLFSLFLACYLWLPELHRKLIVEDELGENLQFLAYTLAFFFFAWNAIKGATRIEKVKGSLLALGSLLLAGEEISWGTRIFHFDIDWLSSRTYQHSADFHNLVNLYGNKSIYVLFFFAQALCVPWIERKLFQAAAPVFQRAEYFWTMLISALVCLAFFWSNVVFVYEMSELVFAVSLLICSIQNRSLKFKTAVVLICSILAQTMVSFEIGDPSVLNYGGYEYGSARGER